MVQNVQKNEIGVCLGIQDSVKGGIRVYILNKSKPVVRRGLKQMVMTNFIIEHMNEYAAETKTQKKSSSDDTDHGANPFFYRDTMAEERESTRPDDYYRGDDDEQQWIPPRLKDTLVQIL